MQEYLRRGRFASAMDDLGFHFLSLALSLGWFTALWGLRLPTLTAGFALYGLILLLRRVTRNDRLKRREQRLRAQLGGELALERLLMITPDKAHFECAVLLSLGRPMELLRSGKDGVLCNLRQEKTLLRFAQLPAASSVEAHDVLALQRAARAASAERAVLCAPCPVSAAAREQAEGPLPVAFVQRDALIRMLGRANPATDSQLVALGKRRKRKKHISRLILDRRRARTYAWYGALLLLMYQATRLLIYALPGLACLALATACRCVKEREDEI